MRIQIIWLDKIRQGPLWEVALSSAPLNRKLKSQQMHTKQVQGIMAKISKTKTSKRILIETKA